jgi:hypothetical protein
MIPKRELMEKQMLARPTEVVIKRECAFLQQHVQKGKQIQVLRILPLLKG